MEIALQEVRYDILRAGADEKNHSAIPQSEVKVTEGSKMPDSPEKTVPIAAVNEFDLVTTFSKLPHKDPVDITFDNISYTVNLGFRKGMLFYHYVLRVSTQHGAKRHCLNV